MHVHSVGVRWEYVMDVTWTWLSKVPTDKNMYNVYE